TITVAVRDERKFLHSDSDGEWQCTAVRLDFSFGDSSTGVVVQLRGCFWNPDCDGVFHLYCTRNRSLFRNGNGNLHPERGRRTLLLLARSRRADLPIGGWLRIRRRGDVGGLYMERCGRAGLGNDTQWGQRVGQRLVTLRRGP